MAEFTFYNTSGELTLSADGITFCYIGRAAHTGTVQPTRTEWTDPNLGAMSETLCGYATYVIDWPGEIIAVARPKDGKKCAYIGAIKSGNTWTIKVFSATGVTASNGFDEVEATDVFVFGAPVPGSVPMIGLFDGNGNVTADLTRKPLTYGGLVIYTQAETAKTMPAGVVVPGILGGVRNYEKTSSSDGDRTARYTNNRRAGCWVMTPNADGSRTLSKANYRYRTWTSDGAEEINATVSQADTAVIIELSGL